MALFYVSFGTTFTPGFGTIFTLVLALFLRLDLALYFYVSFGTILRYSVKERNSVKEQCDAALKVLVNLVTNISLAGLQGKILKAGY